jgi:hypothetical protein
LLKDLTNVIETQDDRQVASWLVYARGRQWQDADVIEEQTDESHLFVLYNFEIFREKSYLTVDGAFPFPFSRFGKAPSRPIEGQLYFFAEDFPAQDADFEVGLDRLPAYRRVIRRRGFFRPEVAEALGELEEPPPFDAFEFNGTRIELTREERAAVRRLVADGFEFNMVVQVFMACGKDETVARTCLLSMT